MLNILRLGLSGITVSNLRNKVTASNVSNINTIGYKKRRVELSEVNLRSSKILRQNLSKSFYSPTVSSFNRGVKVQGISVINTKGPIYETSNQTDLVIDGDGYFRIDLGNGRTAYTRNGALKVSSEGTLVTNDGYNLEPAITIPQTAKSIIINNDGTVQAEIEGESQMVNIGQIMLSRFPNPNGLKGIGSNLYERTMASGEPVIGSPGEEGFGKIFQGYLEDSNVDLAQEQVNLIIDQRTFEANVNIVKTADQIMKTIIDIKR